MPHGAVTLADIRDRFRMMEIAMGKSAVFLTVVLLVSFVSSGLAQIHREAPGHSKFHHWYLDKRDIQGLSCCNEEDCRPVTKYKETPDGGVNMLVEGRWVPVNGPRLRRMNTPDNGAHWCGHFMGNKSTTYCAFVPQLYTMSIDNK